MVVFTLISMLWTTPSLAKITEKETSCDLFSCYSIFEIDKNTKALEGYTYKVIGETKPGDKRSFDHGEFAIHKGSINGMQIEVLKDDLIKVSGDIAGATNNLWGFEILGDKSHLNSTWWNSSYNNKVNLTIINIAGETLVNYTAYLNLTRTYTGTTNFSDLAFINGTCEEISDPLNYYVSNYSSNGHIWLLLPELGLPNMSLCLYYNSSINGVSPPSEVWNSDYLLVQHLEELATPTLDMTSYGNNGTISNNVVNNHGRIGMGKTFYDTGAANSGWINCSDTASLKVTDDDISYGGWVRTARTYNSQFAFGKGINFGVGSDSYTMAINTGYSGYTFTASGVWSAYGSAPTANVWYYVVVVYNGTNINVYQDGVRTANTAQTGNLNDVNEPFGIGASTWDGGATWGYTFNGTIDEVFVSDTAISYGSINQSYRMVADQASLVVWGVIEEQPPPAYNYNISFISPTPDSDTTIGFDYNIVINVSHYSEAVKTMVNLFVGSQNKSKTTGLDANYTSFNRSDFDIEAGTLYSVKAYLTVVGGSNETESRNLIVSTFTTGEIERDNIIFNWGIFICLLGMILTIVYFLIKR